MKTARLRRSTWPALLDEATEAAAVPVMDEIRGHAVEMFIARKPSIAPSRDLEAMEAIAIETQIGKIARPKNVWIVADMPKTRSGKIMRRVITSSSNVADVGNITRPGQPGNRRRHPPPRPTGRRTSAARCRANCHPRNWTRSKPSAKPSEPHRRRAQPLATRHQREHQRAAAAVLPGRLETQQQPPLQAR